MTLSIKQQGVFRGMAFAMATAIIVLSFAIIVDPFHYAEISTFSDRFAVLGGSLILPTFFLIFSIGRIAKFRFFSPEDIDGSGLTSGSHDIKILQSLLQNTLEQFVIVFATFVAWALLMPVSWLSAPPLCSLLFAIGRILFFKGYHHGAPARAYGFALTFYSTGLMFFTLVIYQVFAWIG
ncbi:hypothetical protein VST7929_01460 [Vibrio stylophorae]|uniref:MAPEG family protein n=1 Tax=Vibrio stylophorae TaxID=659351 RepID=A0ABM8ZTF7_9VIBR|nr:MAPEG family protein [Vibrio stylophorae]CAH0533590.1 hypothetical protein VST7929_01460 [Vibrio stylophorae]